MFTLGPRRPPSTGGSRSTADRLRESAKDATREAIEEADASGSAVLGREGSAERGSGSTSDPDDRGSSEDSAGFVRRHRGLLAGLGAVAVGAAGALLRRRRSSSDRGSGIDDGVGVPIVDETGSEITDGADPGGDSDGAPADPAEFGTHEGADEVDPAGGDDSGADSDESDGDTDEQSHSDQ